LSKVVADARAGDRRAGRAVPLPGENVYLWDSEKAARAFFTPELAERILGLYGVPARIEFAEVAALVDNGAPRVA
jgi:hypothetical protein